jgi:ribosomal protein S18 acetylase RimI-like enzyme
VRRLFVEEASRNRGVAKALLEHVCRAADAAGNLPWLRAHVHRENVPSQSLFERCGFRRTAIEYSRPVPPSGGELGKAPGC